MKRLHVHVSVKHLASSIRFYRTVFRAEPSVTESDYAKSDTYWVTDPTGVMWETFHTLGSIPVYGKDTPVFDHGTATTPSAAASGCAK
jgi:hypothetical protein